jgi:hypothetical protein
LASSEAIPFALAVESRRNTPHARCGGPFEGVHVHHGVQPAVDERSHDRHDAALTADVMSERIEKVARVGAIAAGGLNAT